MCPAADCRLCRRVMMAWPPDGGRRDWLAGNQAFRDYVMAELKARGPLRSRDLEDRAQVGWRSSGWTHERNVSQMLEFLWARGDVAVASRAGNERIWDLASRVLPNGMPEVPAAEAKRVLAERRLRSLGIPRPKSVGAIGTQEDVEGVTGPGAADPD